MKKTAFSCVAVLCISLVWSQQQMEISLANGIGQMRSVNSNEEAATGRTFIEDHCKWSMNAGMGYTYTFNKWKLRTGVTYSLQQGETTERFHIYPYVYGTDYEYDYIFQMARTCHYLRIPLMIAYKADKLEIAIGFYGAGLVSNSYWASGFLNTDPHLFQSGGNNLSRFDAGICGEIRYPLDSKFDLVLSASSGFVDVSNGTEKGAVHYVYGLSPRQRTLKNKLLLVGIAYQLF